MYAQKNQLATAPTKSFAIYLPLLAIPTILCLSSVSAQPRRENPTHQYSCSINRSLSIDGSNNPSSLLISRGSSGQISSITSFSPDSSFSITLSGDYIRAVQSIQNGQTPQANIYRALVENMGLGLVVSSSSTRFDCFPISRLSSVANQIDSGSGSNLVIDASIDVSNDSRASSLDASLDSGRVRLRSVIARDAGLSADAIQFHDSSADSSTRRINPVSELSL